MQLESLLKDLASLYRKYGDVDVIVETPDALLSINSLDVDIFNTDPDTMRVIIETEGVEEEDNDVPPTQQPQSQIPTQRAKPQSKSPTRRTRKTPEAQTATR